MIDLTTLREDIYNDFIQEYSHLSQDYFAMKLYGEFGFATCTIDQQEYIIKKVYTIRGLNI